MGIVATTMTWDAYKAEIKVYCNITSTSHDTVLRRFLSAGALQADTYLKNPFTSNLPRVTFASVEEGDAVTVDGAIFTAATAEDETEREFKIEGTNADTASGLADMINSTTVGGSHGAVGVDTVIATADSGVITFAKRYANENEIAVSSSDDDRLLVEVIRTQEDIPNDVIVWVYQYICWRFNNRDSRTAEDNEMGVTSIEWGDQPDMTLLDLYVSCVWELI